MFHDIVEAVCSVGVSYFLSSFVSVGKKGVRPIRLVLVTFPSLEIFRCFIWEHSFEAIDNLNADNSLGLGKSCVFVH